MMTRQGSIESSGRSEYEVGYGRPPKSTQFEKGKSGNPNGRPKKNPFKRTGPNDFVLSTPSWLSELILDDASKQITINTETGKQTMPALAAVLHRIKLDAIKGKTSASKLYLQIVEKAEKAKDEAALERNEVVKAYKFDTQKRVDESRSWKQPDPKLPIHPEDIAMNLSTGLYEQDPIAAAMAETTKRYLACHHHLLAEFEAQLKAHWESEGEQLDEWQLARAQAFRDQYQELLNRSPKLPKRYLDRKWYKLNAKPSADDWAAALPEIFDSASPGLRRSLVKHCQALSEIDVWIEGDFLPCWGVDLDEDADDVS